MSRPPPKRLRSAGVYAALAGIAVATYLPTLRYPLIYDDLAVIERNPVATEPGGWSRVLTRPWWPPTESLDPLYRPLTTLTFKLNHALFGPDAASFRLVNVGLHAIVTVLVAALASRIWATSGPHPDRSTGSRAGAGHPHHSSLITHHSSLAPAWIAGILFAVHPIHAEALGLVVGRAELLAALFVCGMLLCQVPPPGAALDSIRNPVDATKAGAFTAIRNSLVFLAALFSKEHAVMAWPAILLIDLWRGPHGAGRAAWRTYSSTVVRSHHLGMMLALAAFLFARWLVFGGRTTLPADLVNTYANPLAGASLLTQAATPFALVWLMLRQWFAAAPLCPIWSNGGFDLPANFARADVLVGLAAAWLLLMATVVLWRRSADPAGSFQMEMKPPQASSKGARYESPGQRPGLTDAGPDSALKGRANLRAERPASSGRATSLGMALGMFLLFILLPCHFIPAANWLYAERWAYLPSVFLAIACAGLGSPISDFKSPTPGGSRSEISNLKSAPIRLGWIPRVSVVGATLIAALLVTTTIPYSRAWRDQETFFHTVVDRQPTSYHGLLGLLSTLERAGRIPEAGPETYRFVGSFPVSERAWYFRLLATAAVGDWDSAEDALRRWSRLRPLMATPAAVERVAEELRRRGRGLDIEL